MNDDDCFEWLLKWLLKWLLLFFQCHNLKTSFVVIFIVLIWKPVFVVIYRFGGERISVYLSVLSLIMYIFTKVTLKHLISKWTILFRILIIVMFITTNKILTCHLMRFWQRWALAAILNFPYWKILFLHLLFSESDWGRVILWRLTQKLVILTVRLTHQCIWVHLGTFNKYLYLIASFRKLYVATYKDIFNPKVHINECNIYYFLYKLSQ